MEVTTTRKLASIQRITALDNIANSDNLAVATVLGWQCVVKRHEHLVGDLVVYVEVDSILPEKPEFEFLRTRRFRIKTIRLRKQISQGIIFSTAILPSNTPMVEGTNVTDVIGVKKHDPQVQEENSMNDASQPKSKILKYFMKHAAFRYVYFKLNHVDKGWPNWISKTDEERIQICASLLTNNLDKSWYISEKIDGQSATYFCHKQRCWGFPVWKFGVCSRNIYLKHKENNNYWKIAKKYDLENKLKNMKEDIVIQGEIVGPGIQSNKYALSELDFYVFNIIENGHKYTPDKMEKLCGYLGLKTVPILYRNLSFEFANMETKDIVQNMVKISIGKSTIKDDIPREGIVCRLVENPNISFKVINPEFLLKYDE